MDKVIIRLFDFLQLNPDKCNHSFYLVVINKKVYNSIAYCNDPTLWYDALSTEGLPVNGSISELDQDSDKLFNLLQKGDEILAFSENGTLKKYEITKISNNIKTQVPVTRNPDIRVDVVSGQFLRLKEVYSYSDNMAKAILSNVNIPYPYVDPVNVADGRIGVNKSGEKEEEITGFKAVIDKNNKVIEYKRVKNVE